VVVGALNIGLLLGLLVATVAVTVLLLLPFFRLYIPDAMGIAVLTVLALAGIIVEDELSCINDFYLDIILDIIGPFCFSMFSLGY
jgi:hypothetical protein